MPLDRAALTKNLLNKPASASISHCRKNKISLSPSLLPPSQGRSLVAVLAVLAVGSSGAVCTRRSAVVVLDQPVHLEQSQTSAMTLIMNRILPLDTSLTPPSMTAVRRDHLCQLRTGASKIPGEAAGLGAEATPRRGVNKIIRNIPRGYCIAGTGTHLIKKSVEIGTSPIVKTRADIIGETETDIVVGTGTDIVVETGTNIIAETGTSIVAEAGTSIVAETETSIIAETETSIIAEAETGIIAETGTVIVEEYGIDLVAKIGISLTEISETGLTAGVDLGHAAGMGVARIGEEETGVERAGAEVTPDQKGGMAEAILMNMITGRTQVTPPVTRKTELARKQE